ncbi:DEAD-box ATP-dependent RNA helicase 50 [Platanthera guangdongensis]|uniref:DEAD-box ATP-dependent RNA helicase 50 n=1 Tax=Platanthera guangdongensis TaxID=2320717 RepID=A0ABR2MSA4_9ASPA
MLSVISATPSPASPASLVRPLASSCGSSTFFPLLRRLLLPCENSDQIAKASWPLVRSVAVKATNRRQNHTGCHERAPKYYGDPRRRSKALTDMRRIKAFFSFTSIHCRTRSFVWIALSQTILCHFVVQAIPVSLKVTAVQNFPTPCRHHKRSCPNIKNVFKTTSKRVLFKQFYSIISSSIHQRCPKQVNSCIHYNTQESLNRRSRLRSVRTSIRSGLLPAWCGLEGRKYLSEPLKTSFLQNSHFPVPSTPCNASQASLQFSVRQSKLTVISAFRQLPMDTAGAYRMIDEETGENVIVWGGIDDAASPIPSQETITWKPKDIHGQGGQFIFYLSVQHL